MSDYPHYMRANGHTDFMGCPDLVDPDDTRHDETGTCFSCGEETAVDHLYWSEPNSICAMCIALEWIEHNLPEATQAVATERIRKWKVTLTSHERDNPELTAALDRAADFRLKTSSKVAFVDACFPVLPRREK